MPSSIASARREAWGEHFVRAIDRDGLAAGATTPGSIVLRSNLGYTGTQSRLQMLKNREFVDAQRRDLRQARLAHLGQAGRVHRSIVSC